MISSKPKEPSAVKATILSTELWLLSISLTNIGRNLLITTGSFLSHSLPNWGAKRLELVTSPQAVWKSSARVTKVVCFRDLEDLTALDLYRSYFFKCIIFIHLLLLWFIKKKRKRTTSSRRSSVVGVLAKDPKALTAHVALVSPISLFSINSLINMMAGLLPVWATVSIKSVLLVSWIYKKLRIFNKIYFYTTDYLHDERIVLLDLFPEPTEFLKRKHWQCTRNNGEALQIIRLRVGLLFEIFGDMAQSFVNGLLQLLNGNRTLLVSLF